MTTEAASIRVFEKPWGVSDPSPWGVNPFADTLIGEIWFGRGRSRHERSALLVKLLFTSSPLSIQVHPDDSFSQSLGLRNGKTEVWIVLAAAAGARVAVGLKSVISRDALRRSIEDGSIVDLVQWRDVAKGDVIFVAAGVIHAIGAGLVIAEIQQNSDTTFRLFDFGRGRTLDIEQGLDVAFAKPDLAQPTCRTLAADRDLLVSSDQFVVESISFEPGVVMTILGAPETWIVMTRGVAWFDGLETRVGGAVFMDGGFARVSTGPGGAAALVAYPGPDVLVDLVGPSIEGRTRRAGTAGVAVVSSQTMLEKS